MSLLEPLAKYDTKSRSFRRSHLFGGPSSLRLLDEDRGRTVISQYVVGNITIGDVRSTGHEVDLVEPDRVSLVIPLKGTLQTETNGMEVRARPNEALLFSPNKRSTRATASAGSEFHGLPILLSMSDLKEAARSLDVPLSSLNGSFGYRLRRHNRPSIGELIDICEVLHSEISRGAPRLRFRQCREAWSRTIVEKTVEVLGDVSGLSAPVEFDGRVSSRHVRRALEYISENYTTIGTITEVADACEISARTLQNSFRQELGVSPQKAILDYRLDRARDLLLSSGGRWDVTEVALACGFHHLGRFARSYKVKFGESPSRTGR